MSISSRITSIEGHIGNAYNKIEDLGQDLTNVNKNLNNITSELDNIYTSLPKVTEEGTSFTLSNTKKGRMRVQPKGNTSQNTLPNEYQAVEYIESTGTQYIDTNFIANQNSSIEIDFKSNYENVSEEYAIFGSFVGEISLALRIHNNTSINIYRNAQTGIEINCDHTLKHKYFVNKNNFYIDNEFKATLQQSDFTCLNSIVLFAQNSSSSVIRAINGRLFNCKIYDNNILVRNYIPCYRKSDNVIGLYDLVNGVFYTNDGTGNFNKGNNVSIPNPNFPQDIKVVKENNNIKIQNKNLFDKTIVKSQGDGRIGDTTLDTGKKLTWNGSSSTSGYMWLGYVIKDISNYIGKTVRFKTNFSASASNIPQYAIGICDSDGDNRISKANSSTSGNTISFTIPSLSGTQTYLYILLYVNSGGTLNPNDYVDFTNMILTIDNEDMTYVPYQEQNYPINLGNIELCKIGDYQDYIYKNGDNWYKHSVIGKIILDGSENWGRISAGGYFYSIDNILSNILLPSTSSEPAKLLCSHFKNIAYNSSESNSIFISYQGTAEPRIRISDISTVEDFQTWLSTHNTIIYYVLATPIDIQITDSTLIAQLEAINRIIIPGESITVETESDSTNAQLIVNARALSSEGGGTLVLENKNMTITTNGSYSITYDSENYDGLDDVALTVNVTGVNDYIVDFSTGIGYNFVPDDKVTGYNYAKTIKSNWDSSITTMLQMYQGNTDLVFFPLVDTSNVENISRAFYNCTNLEVVPLLNTSSCVGCNYTFNGCTNLKTIPQFDFSASTALSNTFKSCSSLTDESLNNILAICINATAFMQNQPQSNWTLRTIGLSSSQATRCQSLSNYSAFTTLGWTTGY